MFTDDIVDFSVQKLQKKLSIIKEENGMKVKKSRRKAVSFIFSTNSIN